MDRSLHFCLLQADALLEMKHTDLNAKDINGQTALIWAVAHETTSVVQSLLGREDDLDVNARSSDGMTALMLAVTKNNQEIVVELLKADKIDVNAKMNNGNSALLLAYKAGNTGIVEAILYLDSIFDIDISGDDRFVLP